MLACHAALLLPTAFVLLAGAGFNRVFLGDHRLAGLCCGCCAGARSAPTKPTTAIKRLEANAKFFITTSLLNCCLKLKAGLRLFPRAV